MSSDIRTRFGDFLKEKLNKFLPSNITSGSILGPFISNGTKERIRNFTNDAIQRTGIRTFINKTKYGIEGALRSDDDPTISKGFFDSLFYTQTTSDVLLKIAIICLWIIAVLCIISTIISIFRGIFIRGEQTTSIRRFYIHIFLCEFCYLIYILLSMINVALNFRLNSFFCNIGKYGK
jgi:hypothetical protein